MSQATGTVIHGTMRPEDLIPAFIDELSAQADDATLAQPVVGHEEERKAQYDRVQTRLGDIERRMQAPGYYESEDAMWDLDSLFDELNEYAPEGYYFGAHPGDGSDYGYWPCGDAD